jgi:hypothetical protein
LSGHRVRRRATYSHRRATLLHGMVWCKQSCRRRIGTCANGQLRFSKNLGDPRDNAPHDTDCVGGADRAMVCAEALLKLAHWCRQRRQSASGGELCSTSRKTESPPALAGTGGACGAGATLDGAVAGHTSERPSNTEPNRRSAAAHAPDRAGGGA